MAPVDAVKGHDGGTVNAENLEINRPVEVNGAMKKILFIITLTCLFATGFSEARDDLNQYSVEEAMNTSDAKSKLNKGYIYLFGKQEHAEVVSNHGEFMANKKTNAFNKSDKQACQWAFLSAMITFQERVAKEGGNAVINIRSYYKKHDFTSETEFECGNGSLMAGVTLVGDVVTLKE